MVDLFCSGVWEHLVPTEAPVQTNLELDSSELSPSYIFNPDPYIRCLYSYLTGAPVPMVTLEPPAPKTWTSAIRRTSATTASAATSQAALSASVGPATRGPFATMSLTSVSPTLAWSVVHFLGFPILLILTTHPAQHGNCTNLVNNYRCDCLLGFEGEQQQQQHHQQS